MPEIDTYFDPRGPDHYGWELRNSGQLAYVGMGHGDVITATNPQRFIGTSALATCGGIGIYDAEHSVGGVAHVTFEGANTEDWWEVFGREANKLLELAHQRGGDTFALSLV